MANKKRKREKEVEEDSFAWDVTKDIAINTIKCFWPRELKNMWVSKFEKRMYLASVLINPVAFYYLTHNSFFMCDFGLEYYAVVTLLGYFVQKGIVKTFMANNKIEVKKTLNYSDLPKDDIVRRLKLILEEINAKPRYVNAVESDVETRYRYKLSCDIKKLVRDTDNIEHKLGLKKGRLEIENDEGITTFVIKKNVNKIYYLDKIVSDNPNPPKSEGLHFVLGCEYKSGKAMFGNLKETRHVVVGGKTGMGKSNTFEGIIETLMYYNPGKVAFYMLDFCESSLVKYENFANVKFIESDFDSVLNSLNEICEIYEQRKKIFRKVGVTEISEYNKISSEKIPYIIFTVDEASGFREEFNSKQFDKLDDLVKTILKRGRKYGIFTIQAVQRTQDDDFSMAWKSQMSRIGHSMYDLSDCKNLSPSLEIAEKMMKLDTGEFYLILHAGTEPVKIKGCYKDSNIGKKKRKKNQELYWILKEAYNKNAFTNFNFEHKKMEKIF